MPGTEIDGGQIKGTLILDGKTFTATLVKAGAASTLFTQKQVVNSGRVSKAWKIAFAAIGVSAVLLAKRGFGAVISAGAELEKQFANVSTLGNISAETMASMEEQVKSLSSELRKQPVDLTKGLYQAISAGAEAGSEAIDILTESAKFANAGLTTTTTAVNAITNAVNVFGKENLSANRAANLMFKTIQLGKTTAEEFAPQIGRVASNAESLGLAFEEVSAASALLTRTMPTALAITSLEGALRGLTASADEFARAGIDIFEVLKEEGLSGALRKLQELTGGNRKELSKFITDQRAMRGILALLKDDVGAYNELLAKMEDQTDVVTDAVGKQMDTTISRTDGLKVAFSNLAGTIFDSLQPAYDNFLIVSTKVLEVSEKLIGASEEQAKVTEQEAIFMDDLTDAVEAGLITRENALAQMALFKQALALNNALRDESKEKIEEGSEALKNAEETAVFLAETTAERKKRLAEETKARGLEFLQLEQEEKERIEEQEQTRIKDGINERERLAAETRVRGLEFLQLEQEEKAQIEEAELARVEEGFAKRRLLAEQTRQRGLDFLKAEDEEKARRAEEEDNRITNTILFQKDLAESVQGFIAQGWINTTANFLANSDKMIASGTRWRDVMDGVWDSMKEKAISTLLSIVSQQLIQAAIVATGWAPAAALSAIGTGGGSAGAAEIAIASVFSSIGKFIPKREQGGPVSQGLTFTHDDEFVLSRMQTGQVSELLTNLNDRLDKLEDRETTIKVSPANGMAAQFFDWFNYEVEVNQRRAAT